MAISIRSGGKGQGAPWQEGHLAKRRNNMGHACNMDEFVLCGLSGEEDNCGWVEYRISNVRKLNMHCVI